MVLLRALVVSVVASAFILSPGAAQSGSFGNSVVVDGEPCPTM